MEAQRRTFKAKPRSRPGIWLGLLDFLLWGRASARMALRGPHGQELSAWSRSSCVSGHLEVSPQPSLLVSLVGADVTATPGEMLVSPTQPSPPQIPNHRNREG